ncbi:FHA domain-containing protein [Streptomyces sp. NPDC002092]
MAEGPRQLVCRACFTPYALSPAGVVRTRREDTSAGMELGFPTGVLSIPAGTVQVLGREGDGDAARLLEPYDNLSRRHATVRVDAGGRAWIRDEDSTNGTYHQERRIAPGAWVALRSGDRLRLASDIPVAVRAMGEGYEGDDA